MMNNYNKTVMGILLSVALLALPMLGLSQTEMGSTGCEEHGGFNPDLEIGAGTPYTHSSQVQFFNETNIHVVGDFVVDNHFTFRQKNLAMNEDVDILVRANASLTLRGSNLFACEGLWEGIRLRGNATINSFDSSIEDAEIAIRSRSSAMLNLRTTIFNRNRIGIKLLGSPFSNPIIDLFERNQFSCTTPINDSLDEITQAGIHLTNINLVIDQSSTNSTDRSVFSGIENGIVVVGEQSSLTIGEMKFEDIIENGIDMEAGNLEVNNSDFINFEENGILIEHVGTLKVFKTSFSLSEVTEKTVTRSGIRTNHFLSGALINLSKINQYYDLSDAHSYNRVYGIRLIGHDIGFETKIDINNVDSNLYADNESACIYLEGAYPRLSMGEIRKNRFFCSTIDTEGMAMGIYSTGNKSSLAFIANRFSNFSDQTNNLMGIYLKDSNGFNNQVTDNSTTRFGGVFMKLENFKHSLICSNRPGSSTFGAIYQSTGFEFSGDNSGTVFKKNIMTSMGTAIRISSDGIIGQQIHMGNQWLSFLGLDPALSSISCEGCDILANRFEVHGSQSVWDFFAGYSYLNRYYPIRLNPDEIMISTPGAPPMESCVSQLIATDIDHMENLFYHEDDLDYKVEAKHGPKFSDQRALKIYPNPTHDKFTLVTPSFSVSEITIMDVTGRIIEVVDVFDQIEFEFNLEKGIYLVAVRMNDGEIKTQKVLVH